MVPKPLRTSLGLTPGTRVEIYESDGHLILQPIGPRTRIVHRGGRPVLETEEPVEPLTAEDVRALIERSRR